MSDPRRFELGESIPAGFQRMAVALLSRATAAVTRPAPTDRDVHRARKDMRRVRGLLRLVRDGLGPAYRPENVNLRDSARLLSAVRSSAVAATALTTVTERFGRILVAGLYDDLLASLQARHRIISQRVLDDRLLLAGVAVNLRQARSRLGAFPTTPGNDYGYHGPLIPNDSELFVLGIARTHQRGLDAMKVAAALPLPEHLHEWRKRVRYLRYQLDAVSPAWPEVMGGLCKSVHDLAETLGRERDLWELGELVRDEPGLCPDREAAELLVGLTIEVRRGLREQSFRVGTKIYSEEPVVFARRIQSYWDAWAPPTIPMAP